MNGDSQQAPIRTTAATYVFGDFKVEMREGARAAMTVSKKNSYDQGDERSRMCILEIDTMDAADVLRLMQYALDHREERT